MRYSRFGRLMLGPAGLDRLLLEVDADDARLAQPLRPAVDEHALAAADVEQRARARPASNSSSSVALEAGHQAAHDRVGRAVLVVGVAGDDPVLGDGHAAHSRTASPALAILAPLGLAGSPRPSGAAAGARAGVRVRSGTARRRAAARSAARARTCAASSRAGRPAGRRSRPSAHSTTAAMNSTAPRISDWTWPLPLPSA